MVFWAILFDVFASAEPLVCVNVTFTVLAVLAGKEYVPEKETVAESHVAIFNPVKVSDVAAPLFTV